MSALTDLACAPYIPAPRRFGARRAYDHRRHRRCARHRRRHRGRARSQQERSCAPSADDQTLLVRRSSAFHPHDAASHPHRGPPSGPRTVRGGTAAPAAPESLAPSALVVDHAAELAPTKSVAPSAKDITTLRKGLAATRRRVRREVGRALRAEAGARPSNHFRAARRDHACGRRRAQDDPNDSCAAPRVAGRAELLRDPDAIARLRSALRPGESSRFKARAGAFA